MTVCLYCRAHASHVMCKLGVEEWLVSGVMSIGAKTAVRSVYGNSLR